MVDVCELWILRNASYISTQRQSQKARDVPVGFYYIYSTCQASAHLVVVSLCLWNMWKQVKQWYLVDISMAWMHWGRILLPSVIIFWWLVCLSRARYRPNILPPSPVCTRCSINPMNWPFDWWGTAQECWEIGKVRGRRVSEWKRWEENQGFGLWRVTFDTCLSISPLILKKRGSELTFLEDSFKSLRCFTEF